jgi:hypothetical protein
MADFLDFHIGRRPSSLMELLQSPAPDAAALYWLRAMAALQRAIGRRLRAEIQDQLAIDPYGHSAFNVAVDIVARLANRPLDEDQ